MEKNITQAAGEILRELQSLRERLDQLEKRVEELSAAPEEPSEDIPVDFTDVELSYEEAEAPAAPVEPAREEAEPIDIVDPVEPLEKEDVPVETAAGPAPEEAVSEPGPKEKAEKPLRADVSAYMWMKDKPGMSVKNLRSAISLYDRALFIGTLFKEDFALYDRTIGELNALSSIGEAVDYIMEHFPGWDLKSDIVYSFMMAVRKRLG